MDFEQCLTWFKLHLISLMPKCYQKQKVLSEGGIPLPDLPRYWFAAGIVQYGRHSREYVHICSNIAYGIIFQSGFPCIMCMDTFLCWSQGQRAFRENDHHMLRVTYCPFHSIWHVFHLYSASMPLSNAMSQEASQTRHLCSGQADWLSGLVGVSE